MLLICGLFNDAVNCKTTFALLLPIDFPNLEHSSNSVDLNREGQLFVPLKQSSDFSERTSDWAGVWRLASMRRGSVSGFVVQLRKEKRALVCSYPILTKLGMRRKDLC